MLRLTLLFARAFFRTLAHRWRHGPTRPSWPFSFELIITFLRLDNLGTMDWPMPRLRAALDARPIQGDAIRGVRREPITLGGVPCERFVPREGPLAEGAVVYFHGGSYLFGSSQTHADIIARLALGTGRAVIAPAYRLAPEHPYPAQLEDALAVVVGLVGEGTPASSIVLVGDSAGGHQVIVTQLALRDAERPQCRAAVAISPWVDLGGSRPSRQISDDVDWGSAAMLQRHARLVVGDGKALDDPAVSPLFARFEGLAPMLVVTGDAEALYDENRELVARALEAGVDVGSCVLRDLPHNGPMFAAYMPEAARGLAEIIAYVRASLSP